ncbi:MAG: FtsX-like permease family protein [Bacteroidia bacterium]|nr:MAG: FtsX-like permease family protein [Bacteroidia bacterium]
MIKNYLLTAFRNVLRYKGFSLINIFGLSLSMSVCMLIMVVILDQYSYDDIHTKKDRIYRVEQVDSLANIGLKMASNPYVLGTELRDKYAIAEKVVIVNNTFRAEGLYNETRLAFNGLYTNTDFFDVFDFQLEDGSVELMDEPYTMVLSRETADKFFGDEDPIGKFIEIDTLNSYEVVGVMAKSRKKSHIQFEALVSISTLEILDQKRDEPRFINNWETGWGSWIYMLLPEKADLGNIQQILDQISIEKYKGNDETNLSFYLQPLDKIVPGPMLGNELGVFLPKVFILFLGGLALIIIISAAFNYTSLSVARSMLRAREVGVRKTFGAFRSQVIMQFLIEAVVIAVISLLLAIVLLQFLLPAFSGMQMMSLLEIRPEQNTTIYLWFLIFALVTGLFSGALPAFVISAFKPISVLKGITNIKFFSRITLRKILLVSQFVFSMVFIISILLIFKQMNFMINADLGFDAEVIYDIDLQGKDFNKAKAEYSQLPEVLSMSASSHIPGEGNMRSVDIRLKAEDDKYEAHYFSVDENHIETMGLELVAGRNFPENMSTENEKFVIASEMTLDHFQLGSAQDALGTTLILDDSTMVEIIGIIKDYQYLAVFLNQRPLMLRYIPASHYHAFLRLNSPDMTATVDKLERTWKKIDPVHDFEGDFLDDRIKYYYTFFEDIMYTVGFATLLAIIIAAFGLLGMATYSTRTRLKEIGIRKVFGAEVNHIVLLVSKSYMWLMLIAAVIGGIIAYLVNNLWLQNLSKSVDFGMGTILAGVFIVVIVGLLTISSQTLKAAQTNPATTLKSE